MIPIYPENFPNIDQNANTVVVFESINDQDYGDKYERTGYCNRCGDCCADTENIFATVDGNGNPGGLVQVVPGKCAYFRWDNDGLAMCTGRDTNYYKNGCAFAPSDPDQILTWSNCSYVFTKIN